MLLYISNDSSHCDESFNKIFNFRSGPEQLPVLSGILIYVSIGPKRAQNVGNGDEKDSNLFFN